MDRITQIKQELTQLELGNDDVRLELLRELNQLQGGDPNITDQKLSDNYWKDFAHEQS